MTQLRALSFVAVTALGLACATGCAGTSATAAGSTLPVRVLSSEAPSAPHPEPSDTLPAPSSATTPSERAPRIGAPGGSGAGSRRVAPVRAQSGNETVGGLPAGTAGPTGAAGLG
ncbi:MAG TPA: hypothetical protein VHP33_00465 [Polyangiaceae bacterium]|nr:hypothetical protein [Polyangiaceae bacterium]